MIKNDFIENLPDDPVLAGYEMCEMALADIPDHSANIASKTAAHDNCLEMLGIFQAYCEAYGLQYEFPIIASDFSANVDHIRNFFSNVKYDLQEKKNILLINSTRIKFEASFKASFAYVFTDKDFTRIHTLINELRDKINESDIFPANHEERLIKRLETLQRKFYKRMSNVDTLWGLVGDAGVALGRFGKDAQPLVERIKEITQITWRTQARTEDISTDTTVPHNENVKEYL